MQYHHNKIKHKLDIVKHELITTDRILLASRTIRLLKTQIKTETMTDPDANRSHRYPKKLTQKTRLENDYLLEVGLRTTSALESHTEFRVAFMTLSSVQLLLFNYPEVITALLLCIISCPSDDDLWQIYDVRSESRPLFDLDRIRHSNFVRISKFRL